MAIKGILFDLDGTLIDSEGLWIQAYMEMLRQIGIMIDIETAKAQIHGRSARDLFYFTDKIYPQFNLGELEMGEQMRKYFRALREKKNIIIHSSIETLIELSKKYYIAIVSGSPKVDISYAMDLTGIREYVEYVVGAEDCKKGKPDAEGYLRAMKNKKLTPKECLVFEDSLVGIRAAKAAGMRCVALSTYNYFDENLNEEADRVVCDLQEVDVEQFDSDIGS